MPKRKAIYYAVTREREASWDASLAMEEQQKWAEHAVFMNGLASEGFVVLGGPVGDGVRILLIIDAQSEPEIEALLAGDPWTQMGLLRIAKIEPWEIRLGPTAAGS